MKGYVVKEEEYRKYRQSELEKICKRVDRVDDITNYEVIVKVDFSTKEKDFSVVNNIVNQLLEKQYENNKNIGIKDILSLENKLKNIEKKDLETFSEVLIAKCFEIKDIKDIIDVIDNQKKYVFLYMTDEETLGKFIVENLKEYRMPKATLDILYDDIDFKEVARKYLYFANIKLIQAEDIILDISEAKENKLINELINKKIDARSIYREKSEELGRNKIQVDSEECEEY